jgi:hypothetical protein
LNREERREPAKYAKRWPTFSVSRSAGKNCAFPLPHVIVEGHANVPP